MDPHLIQDRIRAADRLLQAENTTLGQIESVRTLLKGINPKVDTLLASCTKSLSKIDKLQSGDIIALSAEAIPELTEDQKRKKKVLLLFLSSWKQLKSEVRRVEKELAGSKTAAQKTTSIGRIIGLAKGPLGLVTLIAVGLVLLNSASVKINITNDRCEPITPVSSIPIRIPGLSLPKDTIAAGETAIAVIPRLTLTVDGTDRQTIRLSGYGLNFQFHLGGQGIDVVFDGTSLLGKQTTIRLGDQPEHQVTIRCR